MVKSLYLKYIFRIFIIYSVPLLGWAFGGLLSGGSLNTYPPLILSFWQVIAVGTLVSYLIFGKGWSLLIAHAFTIYTTLLLLLGNTIVLTVLGVSKELWLLLGSISFLFMLLVLNHQPSFDKYLALRD